MANIFDYLIWRGDLPLSVSPFNEVDGAVFARLSYLPFELIMPCDSPVSVTIADAAAALISLNTKKAGSLRKENDAKLLEMLLNSRRFRDIELFGYSHLFDAATQTQFSAVTFRPSKNKLYVFFRGTDSTLVGWKEDFNMCFVCPVPAQSNAVDYLNRIAASNGGDITVGGHSKGGNLAVYASAFCEQAARRRITHIYNYDGPGFTEDVLNSDSYKSICVLVNTFVPQSSVVGMLLGHEEKYTIIHSTESGIMQHDIYSWELLCDKFTYLEKVNNSSMFIDFTLKHWLAGMDNRQREQFVDTVYAVMQDTNAKTLRDISDNWFVCVKTMLRSLKNMDEDTRKSVSHALRLLLHSAKIGLAQMIQNK